MAGAESAGKRSGPRLLFIDNIRIIPICLVIMTHCSITYGGPGSWHFTDLGNDVRTPFILTVIDSLNHPGPIDATTGKKCCVSTRSRKESRSKIFR